MAPKVVDVIPKTRAKLAPVYTKKIDDRLNPIKAAYTQNTSCAVDASLLLYERPKRTPCLTARKIKQRISRWPLRGLEHPSQIVNFAG